jgi:aldehyde dehydrogenase (NAD+)
MGESAPSNIDPELLARMRAGATRLRQETARQRIARLIRLRTGLDMARQDLHRAFAADFSKPTLAVDVSEIGPVAFEIDHAIRHLRRWMRPQRVSNPAAFWGTRNHIRMDSKGVALIVAPWNFPVTLTLGPLVSAIAAGCAVVLKPSEYAPNVATAVRAVLESCFQADEVSILEGDSTVSEALLALPFDHIYFTGSPRVGQIVMAAAAKHLTSVTLELGGKSPTVVDETAKMEPTARRIAFGKFSNAGQTCIAPDYVLVHERVHDQFLAALSEQVRTMFGGGHGSPDYARVISRAHHARLAAMCEDAVAQGARVVMGGKSDPESRYLSPTILSDVSPESTVLQEEIFGPILPVIPYRDLDEVIQTINGRSPPLALYIFSSSEATIRRLLDETQSGGVAINDTLLQFAHPGLPFGGIHTSGIGRGHGHWGFLEFSNQRAVLRQHWRFGLATLFHPPTSKARRFFVGLMLRIYGMGKN